ncbi:MAG: HYExAFE family protein [Phycisphaerae bacterium]
MARRHIHYEAAFEDYLRSQGIAYIPVDESKKAIFAGARVKSFDFLVYRKPGETWLVDVKGRKFPYDTPGNRRYWENWLPQTDIDGLTQWQKVFGDGFVAMIVFAYHLLGPEDKQPTAHVHPYRGQYYAFLAVPVERYAQHARPRSASWQTVTVPAGKFRELAQPVQT